MMTALKLVPDLSDTCSGCHDTGRCIGCQGAGQRPKDCGDCGGIARYGHRLSQLVCAPCQGDGSKAVTCPSCDGAGLCPVCSISEAKCPLCGASVKWSCSGEDGGRGMAYCQDGRMVSRRYPGILKTPCSWPGAAVVRLCNGHVCPDRNDNRWLVQHSEENS